MITCDMCLRLRHFRCRGNCACSICRTEVVGQVKKPKTGERKPGATRVPRAESNYKRSVTQSGRSTLPPEIQKEVREKLKEGWTPKRLIDHFDSPEVTRRKIDTIRLSLMGQNHHNRVKNPRGYFTTLDDQTCTQVEQMLDDKISISEIARTLSITRDKVRTIQRHHKGVGLR